VYRQAHLRAAERETSVSAMVREYLVGLAGETAGADPRKARMNELLGHVWAKVGQRVSREELHERKSLR